MKLSWEPVKSAVEPVQFPVEPVKYAAEPVQFSVQPVISLVETVQFPPESVKTSVEPVQFTLEPVNPPVEPIQSQVEPVKSPLKPVKSSVEPVTFPLKPVKPPIEPSSLDPSFPQSEDSARLTAPERATDLGWSQEEEGEPWVLVEWVELADFREDAEGTLCRPISLSHGEEDEEACKGEEGQTIASGCSTLSDPQLAGQSSSETSTPEELRTYEDTSSGVESHSDDAAPSPPTMLTPDPDLGIHMGREEEEGGEEGGEIPAGTLAPKGHRTPPPPRDPGTGGSQGPAPLGNFDPATRDPPEQKREVTGFNGSRVPAAAPVGARGQEEEEEEERAGAEEAQRGNE
ncbi:hypothetical protein FKM82_024188 [Ascaphus truei]